MHGRLAPLLAALLALAGGAATLCAQDSTAAQATGRIAGRVVDRETGRPLSGMRVAIFRRSTSLTARAAAVAVETDVDGRFRSQPLAPRTYTVRALQIGYQPAQVDSVVVVAGRTVTVDLALQSAVIQLGEITVEAEAVSAPTSEVSLLVLQMAAPSVSDGISAEVISRSPDRDAADAVNRVTGISVVDNRFVVVRGLPERYSSTLLNGAELSSPDPNRRVVPLDIFPASLLESIVVTKTATPDRPGDFAGGSVEIRTREFPEEFTARVGVSQGYNSLTTFERLPVAPQAGWDVLGFGAARRSPDASARGERFAESFRTLWQPAPVLVRPNLGLSASVGGRHDLGTVPFGAALAFTYSNGVQHVPERLFSVFSGPPELFPADRSLLYEETRHTVDWGAVANLALRPGRNHKLAWRNLYTRSAEETALQASGYDTENSRINQQFQLRYIEQSFRQTQLEGEHQLPGLLQSLFLWRATLGASRRNEPENRQAYYQYTGSEHYVLATNQPSSLWIRDLQDHISSASFDWSVPFSLRASGDAQVKVGALTRTRRRDFFAVQYLVSVDITQPDAAAVSALPPNQAFAAENIGTVLLLESVGVRAQPYGAVDRVSAGYGMLDLFPLRKVRLVAGMRYEDWRLDITPRNSASDTVGLAHITAVQPDWLWSGNLTVGLGQRTNLRFAAFRSVTRPDAREKTFDVAVPVSGACEVSGDTGLSRAAVVNFDARFEFYRRPGEVASISAFYKRFTRPIVETLGTPGGGNCRATTRNALSARNSGLELEMRRELLVPGLLASVNVTLVQSRVEMPAELGVYDAHLPLSGQSPLLVNASVSYAPPSGRLSGSLLFTHFSNRVVRYGLAATQGGTQNPNVYERGRNQLDAKVQWKAGGRVTLSLSGRNLLDAVSEFYHPTPLGDVRQGFERAGMSFGLDAGYAF